ncbi:MAG: hypothetical protein GWN58_33825 [Anaerolineae bacterium]|nr:hypothetical protein [Thermoplasmata archaeon]NIV34258.1 hypothetical protein [Anaerolineae bacterium]NIY06107.1 hypothetical protein [Thermoplasmata archaeon]
MTTAKKKAPAAKAKKTPAKKTATKKPTAKKKPVAKPEETPPPEPTTTFKEVRGWADCKGKVVQLHHPALGEEFHKAKVLHANVAEGTVLVSIATKTQKGRYLLPLDSTVAKVK